MQLKIKSMSKAFYNRNVPTRNLVTTITGIVTLIISILVGFNVLTPEQSTELQGHATTLINAGTAIWGVVTSIILMFKAEDSV